MKVTVRNGLCAEKGSATFESKKCGSKLPTNFWETYSAFVNTFGSTIALGFTGPKTA